MNSKLIMVLSSVFMGLIGLALSFVPSEILQTLGQAPNKTSTLILQLVGGVYFGFSVTNWMAKTILIGGIYARPLAIGNFSHFLIGAIALVKFSFADSDSLTYTYIVTIIYTLFAALFGYLLFKHPLKERN